MTDQHTTDHSSPSEVRKAWNAPIVFRIEAANAEVAGGIGGDTGIYS